MFFFVLCTSTSSPSRVSENRPTREARVSLRWEFDSVVDTEHVSSLEKKMEDSCPEQDGRPDTSDVE